MKAKISIITLGVDNLSAATQFYREGLGLPQQESEGGSISFFTLEGTWLALYPREALAEDIGLPSGEAGAGFNGVTLAHNVPDKATVDRVLAEAVAAGAELVKPAQAVFWGGYSGYFKDPEGYYWEVAYNPFTDLS